MYEPHLTGFEQDQSDGHSVFQNGSSLLDELDKVAPIQRFDAFPKVGQQLAVLLLYVWHSLSITGPIDIHKSVTPWWGPHRFGLDCDFTVGPGE
jgi:hypothetical protein